MGETNNGDITFTHNQLLTGEAMKTVECKMSTRLDEQLHRLYIYSTGVILSDINHPATTATNSTINIMMIRTIAATLYVDLARGWKQKTAKHQRVRPRQM